MSMDTEARRPQATAGQPDTDRRERIDSAIQQFKAWAAKDGIPFEHVLEVLLEGDDRELEESRPPFHTSVAWADIYDANGVKWHVVVRQGATYRSLMANLLTAEGAFRNLLEIHGWLLADKRPLTEEEALAEREAAEKRIAAFRDATEQQKGDTAPRARGETKPAPSEPQQAIDAESEYGGPVRIIEVEEIFKGVTQSGNLRYTVKGFPWKQYGVTCWPDSGKVGKLMALYDLEAWEVGTSRKVGDGIDLKAVVRLKEGDKPDKVVDWLGAHALSEEPGEDILA